MNCHQLIGNWKQVKGAVGEGQGKLSDDNVDVVAGKRDILPGNIQERHGIAYDQTEKEFENCKVSDRRTPIPLAESNQQNDIDGMEKSEALNMIATQLGPPCIVSRTRRFSRLKIREARKVPKI
jgi:uncharacterized protein YjbJ (UPF0337 family)